LWLVALSFPNGFKTRANGRNQQPRAASQKTSLKIASRGLKDGVHFTGAINEKGDCVFFPMGAGVKRNGGLLRIAVFKNGVWWSTSISGPMPSVSDTNVTKTLSIAELTEIDK
jgi:hypothetical protein